MKYSKYMLMAVAALALGAGDLNPPAGSVGPTMKTLTEVEPRTAISTVDMPLTIASPGSYYFVENITTSGGGITITSDDVTIDLMGFTFSGGTGSGIAIPDPHKSITIKNGTVRGWAMNGIAASTTSNSRFQDLVVSNNGTTAANRGLHAGAGCIVSNCTFANNSGDGIRLSHSAAISDSIANENGSMGIFISSGTVTNCSVRNNASTGISTGSAVIDGCVSTGSINGNGISAGAGSVVKNCSAVSNARDGINISGGEVRGCTCYNNDGDGIRAGFDSIIIGNNCDGNTAAGINVAGRRTRIEGNNVLQNGTGIGGVGIRNLIIKNSAARNATANYDIASDNAVGEIVDVTATGGVPITSSSPWANFSYEAITTPPS